ncbi:hypothetical protein Rhopal_002901-T1 [Rhodotorula paludigena]|uniref:Uncharacterized protein n=1 Tax=Rhodotorula paludigena TaxID=86838 RepID=A0AAV5GKC3_9BASI|nr:hypothetical protein Rhopal_002901-T1 [Rhodotorula paludigena]
MHRSLEVHSTAASGASRVIDDELSDSLGSRHKVEDVKRAIELELGEGSPFDLFRVNPNGSIGESLRATSWGAVDFNTILLPVPVSSDFSPPTLRSQRGRWLQARPLSIATHDGLAYAHAIDPPVERAQRG